MRAHLYSSTHNYYIMRIPELAGEFFFGFGFYIIMLNLTWVNMTIVFAIATAILYFPLRTGFSHCQHDIRCINNGQDVST